MPLGELRGRQGPWGQDTQSKGRRGALPCPQHQNKKGQGDTSSLPQPHPTSEVRAVSAPCWGRALFPLSLGGTAWACLALGKQVQQLPAASPANHGHQGPGRLPPPLPHTAQQQGGRRGCARGLYGGPRGSEQSPREGGLLSPPSGGHNSEPPGSRPWARGGSSLASRREAASHAGARDEQAHWLCQHPSLACLGTAAPAPQALGGQAGQRQEGPRVGSGVPWQHGHAGRLWADLEAL